MKRYIEYCRHNCSPRITDSAARLLASEYVELRSEVSCALSGGHRGGSTGGWSVRGPPGPPPPGPPPPPEGPPPPPPPSLQAKRAAGADGGDIPAIPVTVRQLEAVIRIAESLAKMALLVSAWVQLLYWQEGSPHARHGHGLLGNPAASGG